MESKGVISPEDREIYLFGIWQGLFMLLNIITMSLVGLVSGAFLYVLVFAFAYLPLRSFAGGYHAKTPLRCYFASTAITVLVAVMSLAITFNAHVLAVLLPIHGALIIALSPVGNANKPLDNLEKKVYKKKAVQICAVQVIIALGFIPVGVRFITVGIFWALLMVLVLQVTEKLFGHKHYGQE
jgi:accessory gene regulator B